MCIGRCPGLVRNPAFRLNRQEKRSGLPSTQASCSPFNDKSEIERSAIAELARPSWMP